MKFLLDQGLPRSTTRYLLAAGIDVEHVGDLGLAAATDAEILAVARCRDAVVVTHDSDFHALLAASGAPSPSVIRIRRQGIKGHDAAEVIQQVLEAFAGDLQAGVAVTVTHRRTAIRRLPLLSSRT